MTNPISSYDVIRNPVVSIVVPVYNGEKYLKFALDSIKIQTYSNFEVIVVDDGSLDAQFIPSLLEEISDPRFRSLRKDNGGVSSALNLGLADAKGKYFAWLSHDDLWKPNKLETQMILASKNLILCSNYEILDKNSELQGVTHFEKLYDTSSGIKLLSRGLVHGCSILVPISVFEKIGKFNEELLFTQDYDIWLRAAIANVNFHFEKIALIQSRSHPGQTSRNSNTTEETVSLWSKIVKEWYSKVISKDLSVSANLKEFKEFKEFCSNSNLDFAEEELQILENSYLEVYQVSVVIPLKFRPHLVRTSLLSIASQTHRNCNVVIVDDSPSYFDNTELLEFCNQYLPNLKVKVLKNEGKGVSSARNLGIKNCEGDLIAFLDSDDYYLPEGIHKLLAKMLIDESLFAHADYLESVKESSAYFRRKTGFNSGESIKQSLIQGCVIATSTVMIKARLIENYKDDIFDTSLSIGEDSDAWISLIALSDNSISHLDFATTVIRTSNRSNKNTVTSIDQILKRNTEKINRLMSDTQIFPNTMPESKIRPILLRALFKVLKQIGLLDYAKRYFRGLKRILKFKKLNLPG